MPHVQSLEDGSKRPILTRFLPCQLHLYSSIEAKLPQLTSAIARASLWFFIMPEMFRFSTQTVSNRLAIAVDVLCKKSLRWLVTFSCCRANRIRDLWRLLLPFFFLLCCLDRRLSLLIDFFKNRGLAIFSPVDRVAKSFRPTSIPTANDWLGADLGGSISTVSTSTDAKTLPVGVFETVTVLTSSTLR